MAAIASQNAPGAEAELDAAAAEDVQARDAAREHGRRAQREVGDVRREADRRRARRDDRQQRPRVEEARLVGVVLEGDEVEAGDLGELGELDDRVRLLGDRRDEDPELQVVGVVGHPGGGYCAARRRPETRAGHDAPIHPLDLAEIAFSPTAALWEGGKHAGTNTSMFVVKTPPGGFVNLHTHPYSETFVLLRGRAAGRPAIRSPRPSRTP